MPDDSSEEHTVEALVSLMDEAPSVTEVLPLDAQIEKEIAEGLNNFYTILPEVIRGRVIPLKDEERTYFPKSTNVPHPLNYRGSLAHQGLLDRRVGEVIGDDLKSRDDYSSLLLNQTYRQFFSTVDEVFNAVVDRTGVKLNPRELYDAPNYIEKVLAPVYSELRKKGYSRTDLIT